MNHLIVNTDAVLAWDGTTSYPVDVRNHLYVSFDFIATAAVAEGASAAFKFQYAPPSDADPCVPGTWEEIPEVVVCRMPAVPSDVSEVILEGPLAVGARCKATIPCPGRGFLQIVGATEEEPGAVASFQVIALLQGPTGR